MKLITAAGDFNTRELMRTACQYLELGPDFTQKMALKYPEEEKRYALSIYLNDKNNLILEKNTLRIYLKDPVFEKVYDFAVEVNEKPDVFRRVNQFRYMRGMLKEDKIESIYLKRHRIIITKDGRVYLSNGNKIRRVSKAQLTSYTGSYIARVLWNPYCSEFNELNSLTRHALDSLYFGKDLRAYRVCLESAVIENKGKYYEEMKARLPMVYYLRAWQSPYHDFLVPNPDLPTYVKKLFAEESKPDAHLFCESIAGKNERVLKAYRLSKSLKFKNVDAIRAIIEKFKEDEFYGWRDMTVELKTYYKHLSELYEGKVKNIEMLLVNRLDFKNHNQTCVDSIHMFYDALRLRAEYPDKKFKKLDMEYLLKNSLNDIHNELSLISRDDKITLKYKEYNLEKDLPIFEKEVDGYQFLMPRNSGEIIRLAEIMHNCVASYDDRMADGSSKIIYACNNQDVINYIKTGEGNYTILNTAIEDGVIPAPACIEIGYAHYYNVFSLDEENEDTLEMRQCYAPHNRRLDHNNPELKTICDKYFESVKDAKIEKVKRSLYSAREVEFFAERNVRSRKVY